MNSLTSQEEAQMPSCSSGRAHSAEDFRADGALSTSAPSAFTPWVLDSRTTRLPQWGGVYRQIHDGEGFGANVVGFVCVAHPANEELNAQGEANARLIEAAPDLLAVVRRYVHMDQQAGLVGNDLYRKALAALAKATGDRA